MTVVYIVGSYDEHGLEETKATCDREKAIDLLSDERWPRWTRGLASERAKLRAWLDRGDALTKLNGIDLSDGWGGIRLYAVELI